MDALEQVVRDVQTAFNALIAPAEPLVFGFGGREREEAQACPSISWDEPDGDVSESPGNALAGIESIGTMQPRCVVAVWFGDRQTAREACYLLMAAARDVHPDHGTVTFDRYVANKAGGSEHATLGFMFELQARVSLPIPKNPVPVTTEVIVQGHEFTVKIGDGDEDDSDDETVASGSRPLPP